MFKSIYFLSLYFTTNFGHLHKYSGIQNDLFYKKNLTKDIFCLKKKTSLKEKEGNNRSTVKGYYQVVTETKYLLLYKLAFILNKQKHKKDRCDESNN